MFIRKHSFKFASWHGEDLGEKKILKDTGAIRV